MSIIPQQALAVGISPNALITLLIDDALTRRDSLSRYSKPAECVRRWRRGRLG